jgi:hypothetical protein
MMALMLFGVPWQSLRWTYISGTQRTLIHALRWPLGPRPQDDLKTSQKQGIIDLLMALLGFQMAIYTAVRWRCYGFRWPYEAIKSQMVISGSQKAKAVSNFQAAHAPILEYQYESMRLSVANCVKLFKDGEMDP